MALHKMRCFAKLSFRFPCVTNGQSEHMQIRAVSHTKEYQIPGASKVAISSVQLQGPVSRQPATPKQAFPWLLESTCRFSIEREAHILW